MRDGTPGTNELTVLLGKKMKNKEEKRNWIRGLESGANKNQKQKQVIKKSRSQGTPKASAKAREFQHEHERR